MPYALQANAVETTDAILSRLQHVAGNGVRDQLPPLSLCDSVLALLSFLSMFVKFLFLENSFKLWRKTIWTDNPTPAKGYY